MRIISLLLFILFISCQENSTESKEEEKINKFGSISFSYQSIPDDAEALKILLTSLIEDSISQTIDLQNNNQFQLNNIPVGNWNIYLNVYYQDSLLTYSGQSSLLVQANKTTQAAITLNKLQGSIGVTLDFGGTLPSDSITFYNSYPGNNVYSYFLNTVETKDNGYLSSGNEEGDLVLLKTDLYGNQLWRKTYGNDKHDVAPAILEDQNSYIVAGTSASYSDSLSSAWLLKTDLSGNTIWSKVRNNYKYSSYTSFIKSHDNQYIVSGFARYASNPNFTFVSKIDLSGNILWTKHFVTGFSSAVGQIHKLSESGYALFSRNFDGDSTRTFYYKLDNSGNIQYQTELNHGEIKSTLLRTLYITDNEFMVASNITRSGTKEIKLVKIDALGQTIWIQNYGGNIDKEMNSLSIGHNEDILVSGKIAQGNSKDFYILQLDKDGLYKNQKVFGFNGYDELFNFIPAKNNSYIITGYSDNGPNSFDPYLIKYNRYLKLSEE